MRAGFVWHLCALGLATVSHGVVLCLMRSYLKHTLNKYVENDYAVVYFHFGLCTANKPSLSWLKRAYHEFDRK